MTTRRCIAVLMLLYALVYLAPLGVRPLIAPDETRYAEIPREMIESGNWVSPRLNGLRYFEKPPLGYWTTAVSIAAFGKNELAVRLPSALSVGLSAVLIYLLVVRSGRRRRAGLLASAVFLTSLEVYAIGVTNVLDSLLAVFLTGALASFYWALHEQHRRRRAGLLALTGVLCGLAFLTKGFLGLVIPVIVAAPFLALQRRWKTLLTVPWLPILAALAVTLPWSVMIHLREPDFWRYFFWVEHVGRFLDPQGAAQHKEPFWFFLPFLIGSMVHWVPLLPSVVSGHLRCRVLHPLTRYSLIWFLAPFLFFSASSGKLGTYILPCFPPLAILIGLGIDRFLSAGKRSLFAAGAAVSGVLGLSAAALVVVSQLTGWGARQWYDSGETWKWVTGAAAFAVWAALCLLAAARARTTGAVWLFCAAPVLFMLSVNFIIPESSSEGKMPGAFILEHAEHVPPEAMVFADDYLVHAVCWHLERNDISMVDSGGELRYGLKNADSSNRLLSIDDLLAFIATHDRPKEVVVVVESRTLTRWAQHHPGLKQLPTPSYNVEDNGFVLARFSPRR